MSEHPSVDATTVNLKTVAQVTLAKVTDQIGIRQNIRRFARDAGANADRVSSLIRQTTYWIFDEDEDAFGPSKFVGFDNMCFAKYEKALAGGSMGVAFDGAVAKANIEDVIGSYSVDPSLAPRVAKWAEELCGPQVLSNVDQSKWRFIRLPRTRQYWTLVCNPLKYDGFAATQALNEIVWTINRSKPQIGDRVVVWQAKGDDKDRGIIAVGEVVEGLAIMSCPPEEIPFFKEPIPPPGLCIRIKIWRFPKLPIWAADFPWLLELPAAKARGGTVFSLSPEQWHDIVDAAGEPSNPPVDHDAMASGQGFGLSAKARRAVELHAQSIVESHFLSLNYAVEDKSKGNPYDLLCQRGEETLYVEVKGTTGLGDSVFLTRNEVAFARTHVADMVLAIVTGIELTATLPLSARGGTLRIVKPWSVDHGTLSAITYGYVPPAK